MGVVKDGRLMCTAVAGHADLEHNRKVEPDTTFLVASVTKTVTATALMRLHDAGRFRLDDDINAQLGFAIRSPHCPNKPVTYRQLLTHTSPIKDYKDLDKLPIDQLLPGDSTVPVGLDEYAHEHIFDPLGMKDTSYFLRCLDRARIAMPYTNTPPGKFKPFHSWPGS